MVSGCREGLLNRWKVDSKHTFIIAWFHRSFAMYAFWSMVDRKSRNEGFFNGWACFRPTQPLLSDLIQGPPRSTMEGNVGIKMSETSESCHGTYFHPTPFVCPQGDPHKIFPQFYLSCTLDLYVDMSRSSLTWGMDLIVNDRLAYGSCCSSLEGQRSLLEGFHHPDFVPYILGREDPTKCWVWAVNFAFKLL